MIDYFRRLLASHHLIDHTMDSINFSINPNREIFERCYCSSNLSCKSTIPSSPLPKGIKMISWTNLPTKLSSPTIIGETLVKIFYRRQLLDRMGLGHRDLHTGYLVKGRGGVDSTNPLRLSYPRPSSRSTLTLERRRPLLGRSGHWHRPCSDPPARDVASRPCRSHMTLRADVRHRRS